jgi:transcriptional regulator with XRE-family HTH domain
MFNARAIKAHRHAANLKQQDAARELGISAQWLCRIEMGRSKPSAGLVEKMVALYNQPATSFVEQTPADHGAILEQVCNLEADNGKHSTATGTA